MSRRRGLNNTQERHRTQGLRLLARIIARHCLEHHGACPIPVGGEVPTPGGQVAGSVEGVGRIKEIGENGSTVNARLRDDGNVARREANQ